MWTECGQSCVQKTTITNSTQTSRRCFLCASLTASSIVSEKRFDNRRFFIYDG
nr:MAG TPA: hypothetical protein [Caudoviricetes sp.]